MPTGRTNAPSSREKVLKAATALFASKGFHETSTREVARRARLNEITIYRLFKNKQELYLQVLNKRLGPMSQWLSPILQSSANFEETLLRIAEHLEELLDPVFLRLVFYAALEKPELLKKCYTPRLSSFHAVLADHIQQQISNGVLKNADPMLMGQALAGIITYHQILCQLLGGSDFRGCVTEHAKTYVEIWLRGALTPNQPARRRSSQVSDNSPAAV